MSRVSLDTLITRSNNNMDSGTHPVVRETALEVVRRAYKEGINVQFSEGNRSFTRQNKLYAQGRTAPGNIVTNAKAGYSWHNFGIAADFFVTSHDGRKALWVVDNNWRRVARLGKDLGFEWGGDWKSFRDYPHFQMTDGLSLSQMRAGKRPDLKSKVKNPIKPSTSKPSPSKPSVPSAGGSSVVDYMVRNDMDSSYSNRAVLAKENGIKDYTGSPSQNTQLLKILKGEVKPSGSKPASKEASVVDYMKSKGMDSSYSNRAKLAKEYGIQGFTGQPSQNMDLLKAIKGGKPVSKPAKPAKPVKPSKSIAQMADEVDRGDHGNGHVTRQNSLKVDAATYAKVRSEVNKRAGVRPTKPSSKISVGSMVTTRTLFTTQDSTKNQRKTPIKGYINDIKNSRRNEVRLRSKNGGDYIGFTRKKDII